MKNKNIILGLGLGLGLLANLNNNTKKRSSKEIEILTEDWSYYESGDYIERIFKSINTDDKYDYQIRIKAPEHWNALIITDKVYMYFEIFDRESKVIDQSIEIFDRESKVIDQSIRIKDFACSFKGEWKCLTVDDYINIDPYGFGSIIRDKKRIDFKSREYHLSGAINNDCGAINNDFKIAMTFLNAEQYIDIILNKERYSSSVEILIKILENSEVTPELKEKFKEINQKKYRLINKMKINLEKNPKLKNKLDDLLN